MKQKTYGIMENHPAPENETFHFDPMTKIKDEPLDYDEGPELGDSEAYMLANPDIKIKEDPGEVGPSCLNGFAFDSTGTDITELDPLDMAQSSSSAEAGGQVPGSELTLSTLGNVSESGLAECIIGTNSDAAGGCTGTESRRYLQVRDLCSEKQQDVSRKEQNAPGLSVEGLAPLQGRIKVEVEAGCNSEETILGLDPSAETPPVLKQEKVDPDEQQKKDKEEEEKKKKEEEEKKKKEKPRVVLRKAHYSAHPHLPFPPHVFGRNIENPSDDIVIGGRKLQKPRMGVRIPYRNLTSQIITQAELAQELLERSLKRSPAAPEGGDLFFTKKLMQRLANRIPSPQEVTGDGSQKKLPPFMGDRASQGDGNGENSKIDRQLEKELALKQLEELPVGKKGRKPKKRPAPVAFSRVSQRRGRKKKEPLLEPKQEVVTGMALPDVVETPWKEEAEDEDETSTVF